MSHLTPQLFASLKFLKPAMRRTAPGQAKGGKQKLPLKGKGFHSEVAKLRLMIDLRLSRMERAAW